MAHICLRETPDTDNTATYTTTTGSPSTIAKLTGKIRDDYGNDINGVSNVESVHVVFNFDTATGEVTATDFLGGGLHMAQAYTAYVPQHNFIFNTQSESAALPKFTKKYPFNKDFDVDALELFFPEENENCARLDYFGLAYADGLLFNTAKEANNEIVYYQPKKFEDRKEADKCSCDAKCPDMQ
uniref:Uncharacterized protein n=1 Tax=Panagrolaimus sp. PS1159 TaxID=55785 RepID=A0AC35GA14_9BILA